MTAPPRRTRRPRTRARRRARPRARRAAGRRLDDEAAARRPTRRRRRGRRRRSGDASIRPPRRRAPRPPGRRSRRRSSSRSDIVLRLFVERRRRALQVARRAHRARGRGDAAPRRSRTRRGLREPAVQAKEQLSELMHFAHEADRSASTTCAASRAAPSSCATRPSGCSTCCRRSRRPRRRLGAFRARLQEAVKFGERASRPPLAGARRLARGRDADRRRPLRRRPRRRRGGPRGPRGGAGRRLAPLGAQPQVGEVARRRDGGLAAVALAARRQRGAVAPVVERERRGVGDADGGEPAHDAKERQHETKLEIAAHFYGVIGHLEALNDAASCVTLSYRKRLGRNVVRSVNVAKRLGKAKREYLFERQTYA